ncbi:hypothetical protein B0H13DRAFT_2252752 [Mycena leptocephala]|nr:hypothetical protein B0H13DRAFT_2252752 [Mycena leptocephala]
MEVMIRIATAERNIKWPELNAHNGEGDTHAMPVHNTGRAGFAGDDDLSRAPSVNTFAASSTDFHSEDPYAVPPLPHLNPGMTQPAYYDPYRGPVPQTFNEAHGAPPADWAGGEAIPMTQMAGRASPGPGMMGGPSPGPQAAYGAQQGRASPGPQAAYGGGM